MTPLELILAFKIIVTIVFVIAPLVFQPLAVSAAKYGLQAESRLVFNLYIAALTALLVNYALGLQQSLAGEFPLTVIYVGIVSNLGATAVLCKERFFNSKRLAPVADWLAISVFGSIGLLFVASVIWQGVFSNELW